MKRHVSGLRFHELQIGRIVVASVAILMVDDLFGGQGPTHDLFHPHPVLKALAVWRVHQDISVPPAPPSTFPVGVLVASADARPVSCRAAEAKGDQYPLDGIRAAADNGGDFLGGVAFMEQLGHYRFIQDDPDLAADGLLFIEKGASHTAPSLSRPRHE